MCKDNKKRYYTIQEIAELLGITEEKAHALTLRDNFPKTEIVLQTVVPAKPFVEWLTAQADSKEADNE